MITLIGILAIAIAVLLVSADLFVRSSASVARRAGISPLVIGMVVVGFGTSAPELLVSALSAMEGASGVALGNAWGSNIANIGLILGVTAIARPVVLRSGILRRELPGLLGATVLGGLLVLDGRLGRVDAGLVMVAMLGVTVAGIRRGSRPPVREADPFAEELLKHADARGRGSRAGEFLGLFGGLLLLLAGSRAVVWAARGIAESLGVSGMVIGLTVVAVGTSLPELASSLAALRRGEDEIVFGNIIGSNLFNTLAVVGLAGLIRPLSLERASLMRDFPVMLGLTILLGLVGLSLRGRPGRVTRVEGGVLLLAYLAYVLLLFEVY